MSDLSDIILRIRVDIVNSAAIMGLVSNMNKMQTATDNVGKSVETTGKKSGVFVSAFDKVTGHLAAVERKMDAVFRASVHMQAMGRDLEGFAKKVGSAVLGMTNSWGQFEFTLIRAAAAAEVYDKTSPMFDNIKVAVMGAAHELRLFPTEEVAKGLYFWQSTTGDVIKTQADLDQTMKNVTATMKLAAMTDSNYESVIKGVYSVLKQFNLTTKDTTDVSALLYYATQKTALELPDLINAFKMTGAVMGNAKEPLQSMVAVLGAVGNAGFRGSQAGRALRQTYIKIVKPTAAAKTELDKLFKAQGGYNKVAFTAKGNFIGMEKYITILAKATKNMTYQQRAHLLAVITTANELPVMTQMLRMADQATKDGAKSWVDFAITQEAANKSFQASWDNLATSWRGVVGGLKQSIMPILLNTGQVIAQVLTPTLNQLNDAIWSAGPALSAMAKDVAQSFKPLVDWVGKAIQAVIKWGQENPKLMKQIAKFAVIGTIISGVAGAILLAAGTFTFLLANVVLVVAGMAPLLVIFVAAGAAIGLFATKVYQNVGGIQDAFKTFGAALARFFKLLIFGNDDAVKSTGDLMHMVSQLADRLVTSLAHALNVVSDALNSLSPGQVKIIRDIIIAIGALILVSKGLNVVSDGIDGVSKSLRGLKAAGDAAKTVSTTAFSGLGKAASGAETVLSASIQGIIAVVARLAPGLVAALGPVGVVIAAAVAIVAGLAAAYETNFLGFKDFVDGIIGWIVTNVMPVVGSIFGGVADVINNMLLPALKAVGDYFGSVLGPLFDQIGKTVEAAGAFFGLLADAIAGAVGRVMSVLTELAGFIGTVLNAIGINVTGWSVTVESIFRLLAATLNDIVFPFLNGVFNIFKGIFEGIVKFLTGVFKVIEGIFRLATAILKGDWKGAWNAIVDIFRGAIGMVEAALRTAAGVIEGVVRTLLGVVSGIFSNVFGTGPGSIYNTVIGAVQWLASAGGQLIRGLIGGISDMIGWAIGQVTGFMGSIYHAVTGFFGIHSPSTLFIDIGKNIIRGLWNGILSLKDWILNKVMNFINTVIPGPIRDILGIHSPSRLMAEIGQNIVQGLAHGIIHTDDAKVAMTNLATDLANTAQKASANIGVTATGSMQVAKTTEATRTINLNVDVTSTDGSVSQVDLDTLSGLITGSDMVRTLERMATVG